MVQIASFLLVTLFFRGQTEIKRIQYCTFANGSSTFANGRTSKWLFLSIYGSVTSDNNGAFQKKMVCQVTVELLLSLEVVGGVVFVRVVSGGSVVGVDE